MSDDQFTKLFKYIQREFKKVDNRFEQTATNIAQLINTVDAYAKQTETYMQEMLVLGHKVDRHEQWILKAAKTTGVKLSA
jgi:hypothetical protein